MSARFRVREVFQLAGRGVVLAGAVLDGEVRVAVVGLAQPLAIVAVEFVLWRAETGDESVALVLRDAPPVEELRRHCPPGAEVSVDEPPRDRAAIRSALQRF